MAKILKNMQERFLMWREQDFICPYCQTDKKQLVMSKYLQMR